MRRGENKLSTTVHWSSLVFYSACSNCQLEESGEKEQGGVGQLIPWA